METNEQQNKSTRTFEEWKIALIKLIRAKHSMRPDSVLNAEKEFDERIKPYYDQGLMPDVCYQELFNR